MKSIFYFFILIILCITALGPPINYDKFVYTPTSIDPVEDVQEDKEIIFDISTDLQENHLVNPTQVKLILGVNRDDVTVSFDGDKHVEVELYKNSTKIGLIESTITKNYNSITNATLGINNPLEYTLDLSKTALVLPDGNYTIRANVKSNDIMQKGNPEPLEISFSYLSDKIKYTPASRVLPRDRRSVTAYYIDGYYSKHLVPVTSFTPLRDAGGNQIFTAKSILEELRRIPKEGSGLLPVSPISVIPSVYYIYLDTANSTSNIDIYANLLTPNPDQRFNRFAVDAFVKSFTALSNIDKVQFTTNDGKKIDSILDGIMVKDPIVMRDVPKAYLGLENPKDNVVLLVDYRLEDISSLSIQEKSNILFDTLKSGIYQDGTYLIETLPKSVELKKVALEGKTLHLDFSNHLKEGYKGNRNKENLMMDSLILSFLSIPEVQSVMISVEGRTDITIGDWELSKPITGTIGVNPID